MAQHKKLNSVLLVASLLAKSRKQCSLTQNRQNYRHWKVIKNRADLSLAHLFKDTLEFYWRSKAAIVDTTQNRTQKGGVSNAKNVIRLLKKSENTQ